jgi:hypothetical protein
LSLLVQPDNILVYWPDPINIMFSSGFCPNSFFVLDIYNNKNAMSVDSVPSSKTNIFQSKLIYCRHFRTYSRCAMFDWSDTERKLYST